MSKKQKKAGWLDKFFGFTSAEKAVPAKESFLDANLRELEILLGKEDLAKLKQAVSKEMSNPPRIAIIGKSGVGKTTTINNLFSADWHTSSTVAGTTAAQTKVFELEGGAKLSITDMPGLGEDLEADRKYEEIYRRVLPDVDLVLWVIQANAKDLAEDQRILREVIIPALKNTGSRLVVGLNQVDKIGPGVWNDRVNFPSPEQEKSIKRRCQDIAEKLSKATGVNIDRITYYSAMKRYRLVDLLTILIEAADHLGWKLPYQPKDPFELADPSIQDYVRTRRSQNRSSSSGHN